MKKIVLFLLFAALILLSIFFSSLYMIDFNKVYSNFATSAKIENTDLSKLNYKIQNFPSPELIIQEVTQEGKLELKNVKIKFSLMSLLKFDYKISGLEVGDVRLYLSHDDVSLVNHHEFISELINKEAINLSVKIKNLIFVESDKDIPLIIHNLNFSGSDKISTFSGSIDSLGSIKGDFKKDGENVTFDLNIDSKNYQITLQEFYERSILQNGKASIITSNLIENFVELLPDIANFSDKFVSEEVKINFDIDHVDNKINLKNIIIDSKSIQGNGNMSLSTELGDVDNVEINFSKIDLNSLRKKDNSTQNDSTNLLLFRKNNNFDFNKNHLKAQISAKLVQLDDHNIVTDFNLSALVKEGKLNIEDFFGIVRPIKQAAGNKELNIPDKIGEFRIIGSAVQNSFRSLFTGQIALTHDNLNDLVEFIGGKDLRSGNKIPYTLIGDIKFSSVDVSLQNLLLKTPDVEISGNVSTKFIGDAPRTNANLKFTKIDLDSEKFPALKQLYEKGLELLKDSKKEEYLSKFIPIRKIKAISNYDISFDKLMINKTEYNNLSMTLGLSPGRIRLENFNVNYDKNKIDMSLDLLASGIKPSFNLMIHDGILEMPYLEPKNMLNAKNQILNDFALDKVDLNIDAKLKKIYNGSFEMNNVVFRAKNNKSLFEISTFNAQIFGGKMLSSGSILLEPYTLNFVYAINSANISEILSLISEGLVNNSGVFSASGMWSTNGNSEKELLYNLYTKSNIITKDITINNFSIDNMVQEASAPNYNTKNFNDDLKQALLTGQTEISDLKAILELSKGIFSIQQIAFKTKYTAGSASANFNLYDFNLDLDSIFSFYISKTPANIGYTDYATVKMPLKATGNLFSLKKDADTKNFEELLKTVKRD